MKLVAESCSSISISNLQKTIRKMIDRDHPDSSEQEIFDFTKEELDKFSVNGQHFSYSHMKNRLGGYRWFFLCPKCETRAGKLFLPPESSGLEHKYLCKSCHGLQNQSAVIGKSNIYKKVLKPLKRMKQIEESLEKGYLTSDKTEELLNEYDALEQSMKETPEYRLYIFKRRQKARSLK